MDKDDIVSVFSFPKFRLEENTLIYLADNTEKGKHNFVGFRQSEFSGRFIFTISNKENQKQGLTVYKDETHYFRALYNPSENKVEFTKKNNDLIINTSLTLSEAGKSLKFSLIFDKSNYQIIVSDGKKIVRSSMNSRHLTCEESDSPFTGIIIGLTRGNGKKCQFNNLKLNYKTSS